MEKEPLRTTGKRYIEMTTAEWIGRLLMPVNTFHSELKEGCGEILKLRQEKEIKSAVEWNEARTENQLRIHWNWLKKRDYKEVAKFLKSIRDKAFEDVVKKV